MANCLICGKTTDIKRHLCVECFKKEMTKYDEKRGK